MALRIAQADLRAGEARPNDTDRPERSRPKTTAVGKKVWIDLDNSPHVPFFLPIIEQLEKRGIQITLTARDSYQVCELLRFNHVSCEVIGKHWGKNWFLKVLGTCVRSVKLLPLIRSEKPDLAVSHGSRAQEIASFVLRTPSVRILDYEHATRIRFVGSQWLFVPECIPTSAVQHGGNKVLKYPGLKEDVYVPRFRPDASIKDELGFKSEEIIVTVRPPATEAHYHNPEADVLLDAALHMLVRSPHVRVILIPRNARQDKILRTAWSDWVERGLIVIPDHVVDGLNLIWHSDLVISGGGTMNREAAALGVPVYSIFRGRIGAVDRYLVASGRLVLIESVDEIRSKIVLEPRRRVAFNSLGSTSALNAVVDGIVSLLENKCLPDQTRAGGAAKCQPPLTM